MARIRAENQLVPGAAHGKEKQTAASAENDIAKSDFAPDSQRWLIGETFSAEPPIGTPFSE